MFTIEPSFSSARKWRIASRAHMNEPRRFTASTRSKSALESSSVGREIWMPALLTSTSMPPRPSIASATMRTTSSSFETSPWTSTSRTPSRWTLATQLCTCSSVSAASSGWRR